jgi:hypothetical protein
MASVSQYVYSPLLTGQIRLLRLMPSADDSAAVHGQLVHYPLLSSYRTSHPFEALSYTWGGSLSQNHHVCLGDKKLGVTANLHSALLRLRDPVLERVMWIDAVCINQQDTTERSDQVRIMAVIYSRASRVVVWLGESENDSDRAVEVIHLAAIGQSKDESGKSQEKSQEKSQDAVIALLRRSWFRRVWVSSAAAATLDGWW